MIKIRQTIIVNIAAAAVTLAFTHGGAVVPTLPHADVRDTNPHVVIAPASCRLSFGGC